MCRRFFIFLIVILLFLGVALLWWKNVISPVNSDNLTPIMFTIPQGQSIKEIANNLQSKKLIKDKIAFFIYIRLSSLGQKIQAGNFRLNQTMNMKEIAHSLTSGTNDVWVVIIEGLRNEEIALLLAQDLSIPESEFLRISKEGYMFPDTYLIPKDATAEKVKEIISKNFDEKVTDKIINKGEQQGLDLDEIITLASIIEREVKDNNDRKIIAGILLKRLNNNWPLQTDATIQYALGYQSGEKSWWKKNLTAADLLIDSPYNTYQYTGLPPDPICNPGLSSILSVVEPQTSSYWFYLSDKQGKIHYAVSQEEHEANIEQYLH